MTTLRSHWSRNEATIGAWLSIPSIVSAELAARTGFDYVCLDNQHGVFAIRADWFNQCFQAVSWVTPR